MRARRRFRVAALVLMALLSGMAATAHAGAIVVPNANTAATGGTDNRFPFLVTGGMRYQEVYASSQFSAFGGTPQLITEIDLRNGVLVNEAFTATIPNITISLSTTAKAPDGLSATFANNVGPDNTLVYSGSLTLSSTNANGPGGTKVFDVAIKFQTPFLYDPTKGNLLLDVDNLSGATSNVNADFFDAVNITGDPVSRLFGGEGNPGATSGSLDSLGLIAQFQFAAPPPPPTVPEPSSLALLSLGGLALTGWRRWKKRVAA
jgi:PEP-CTERM motif